MKSESTRSASVLRRVISDTDEMEVASSSSSSSSSSASSPSSESSPVIHRSSSTSDFFAPDMMMMRNSARHSVDSRKDNELFRPLLPDDETWRMSQSFPEQLSHSSSLFPKIMEPLHRASQAMGFPSFGADTTTTLVVTTDPGEEPHVAQGFDYDVASSFASGNNLLDKTWAGESQRSIQSHRSNVSLRSEQSTKSSQSWGQMAVIDLPPPMNEMDPPTYVLEESHSSQELWRQTAGNRPIQPFEERAFFERMWAENFARSQVEYGVSVEALVKGAAQNNDPSPMVVEDDDGSDRMYSSIYSITSAHRSTRQEDVAEAILVSRMNDASGLVGDSPSPSQNVSSKQFLDKDTTFLWKGINAFGTTVSKSFAQTGPDGLISVTTVNISIHCYRVVESKRHGRYAQFHVIYREGNMRDTIGVWKRYRDFEMLANKITDTCQVCSVLHPSQHFLEPEVEQLPNAVTSWRLMKKRKRWYRCLDAGYLSLKVFLLERFLHDVLFESSSPQLLRNFVLSSILDDPLSSSTPNSP